MKLLVLDMPEEMPDLARWLERQLVGTHLSALVAELTAVHGSAAPVRPLAETLGPRLQNVLESGLAVLPPEQIRALLTQPRLLLALQDEVLLTGAEYWEQVLEHQAGENSAISAGRKAVLDAINPRKLIAAAAPSARLDQLPHAPEQGRRFGMFLAFAAIAAALAVVVIRPWDHAGSTAPRGWARPGALAQSGAAAEYWKRLRAAASEWLPDKEEDRAALSQRLADIRRGCAALQAAEHRPLSPADRTWLHERCRAWDAKFAQYQADLEAGMPPDQVAANMKATLQQLLAKLKEKEGAA